MPLYGVMQMRWAKTEDSIPTPLKGNHAETGDYLPRPLIKEEEDNVAEETDMHTHLFGELISASSGAYSRT